MIILEVIHRMHGKSWEKLRSTQTHTHILFMSCPSLDWPYMVCAWERDRIRFVEENKSCC